MSQYCTVNVRMSDRERLKKLCGEGSRLDYADVFFTLNGASFVFHYEQNGSSRATMSSMEGNGYDSSVLQAFVRQALPVSQAEQNVGGLVFEFVHPLNPGDIGDLLQNLFRQNATKTSADLKIVEAKYLPAEAPVATQEALQPV